MTTAPCYLDPPPSLAELITTLLRHIQQDTRTHIIICTDRSSFIEDLSNSLSAGLPTPDKDDDVVGISEQARPSAIHPLLVPTLYNISSSREISLAFVASIPALQAYLSTLPYRLSIKPSIEGDNPNPGAARLLLLSSLALHKSTSQPSAQSVGRTVALATEAAWQLSQQLWLVECNDVQPRLGPTPDGDQAPDPDSGFERPPTGTCMTSEGPEDTNSEQAEQSDRNPWDEHIPVVSPSTRAFGGGDKAWMQKTVKARDVVARWCIPKTLEEAVKL